MKNKLEIPRVDFQLFKKFVEHLVVARNQVESLQKEVESLKALVQEQMTYNNIDAPQIMSILNQVRENKTPVNAEPGIVDLCKKIIESEKKNQRALEQDKNIGQLFTYFNLNKYHNHCQINN